MSTESKINLYIENYLNNYLKIENPEFAVLLSGKWGSGKTHFIEKYIEYNKDNEDIKFIKVSLFGLKELDSIDEQIFQNLHPLLGNRYVKLTGNIVKNALKFGMKVDWDGDHKNDGTVNIDSKSFNPLDFFSDEKESKKELVFVFDDLERTDIELIEILGYINSFVEQSKFKVIILGNEEKIIDKNNDLYGDFKEKVIGKTFEVQHEFEKVLNSFIEEKTDKSKQYLLDNIHIIQKIYKKANYNNLRHVKQILLDIEYFINLIDSEFLKNKEFVTTLINNFFALSIEAKGGKLKEEELLKNSGAVWNFMKDDKTDIEKIYEKYDINETPLFSGQGWVNIIFKSSLGREVINKVISDLSFFLESKEHERPSWVKLWHYRELENDDFEEALNDVIEKFNTCSYEVPEHFLHVIALLIFLSKEKLCDLSMKDIQSKVDTCVIKYRINSQWKDKLFEDRIRFNGTGLGYMNDYDKDFRKLFKHIREENEKIYSEEIKRKEGNKLNIFLKKIIEWDEEFINNLLFKEYNDKPIFQNLSSKSFVEVLYRARNKNITELGYVLHSRYSDDRYLNNKPYYCYLTDELSFWEDVKKELKVSIDKTDKLRKYILNQFNNHTVESIIEKLKSCDESN